MKLGETEKTAIAVLFSSGEPVPAGRFAQLFDYEEAAVHWMMRKVTDYFDEIESPLKVLRLENTYQLCTREEYAEPIKRALEIRRNQPLSQAAMEVLAVIAYNQPVTRAFVEQVRGVDSSGTIGTLVEKGLVEERGRLDLPGRPVSFGTTAHFLRSFGLKSIRELPVMPREDENDQQLEGQVRLEETPQHLLSDE